MLNGIAHALFFVCVLGQITVGTSPAMSVLLAAIGIALMLIKVGTKAPRRC
jgi:hypothetical protein